MSKDVEKLVIPPKRYKGETMVVSSRLPVELVKKIDELAEKTGRTRNEILEKFLIFALDNLE